MIQLQPLRCIKTIIDDNGEREYWYAPHGSNRAIYHIRKGYHSWICFVNGSHSNTEPHSIHFFNVLRQMHIHYRTVYSKQIREIIQ